MWCGSGGSVEASSRLFEQYFVGENGANTGLGPVTGWESIVWYPQLVPTVAENLYDTTMLAQIPPPTTSSHQHPLWQQHYDSIAMRWGGKWKCGSHQQTENGRGYEDTMSRAPPPLMDTMWCGACGSVTSQQQHV